MQREEIESRSSNSSYQHPTHHPQCDLGVGSCGSCLRAGLSNQCEYRDPRQLRIRNQSQSIQKKFQKDFLAQHIIPPTIESLESDARNIFFQHHVTGKASTWSFLKQYYQPSNELEHLSQSIDAVSLAYFSLHFDSAIALAAARERYVSALRMTCQALQNPETVTRDTTLLSALLLDLYEKITVNVSYKEDAWVSHTNGALALVTMRGLQGFEAPTSLRLLLRLITNLIISCIVSENRVPAELVALQEHVGRSFDTKDPKWRLSDCMVQYANLRSDMRRHCISTHQIITASKELDAKLRNITLDMPNSWKFVTTLVDVGSDRIYGQHFDSYPDPDRHTTQVWNVFRLTRIILNESIIQHYLSKPGNELNTHAMDGLRASIVLLVGEICASVPQYLDCCSTTKNHAHTPSRKLDIYTLIYPLYVCGWSKSTPEKVKDWTVNQLRYMASHFETRNAELVASMLDERQHVEPWKVYAMLGSYALVA
jgi:hypothetical protein